MNHFEIDWDPKASVGKKKDLLAKLHNAKWTLDSLLIVIQALKDPSEQVRMSALDSLMNFAFLDPEPVYVSPVRLLMFFFLTFFKTSGPKLAIFNLLLKLHTDEADHYLELLLNDQFGECTDDEYEQFLEILSKAERPDIVSRINLSELPKEKRLIIQRLFKPSQVKGPDTIQ